MLIARYRATGAESEKLLILTAMRNNASGSVFEFLGAEALATKNQKIRDLILPMLGETKDAAGVLRWVREHHTKLSPKDIAMISDYGILNADFTSALYGRYIQDGWVPDNDFFGRLYENTLFADRGQESADRSPEDIRHSENISNLEKTVLGNKAVAAKWAAYKTDKEKFARSIYSEIKAEYDVMVKQFSEKLERILDAHRVDPEKKKEFFSGLSSAFIDKESFDKAVDLFKLIGPDQAPSGGGKK
jgi:hypothetical protein